MRLSKKALAVAESATLRLSAEIARLRRAGRDVVNLLEGEADLPASREISDAVIRALRAGHTRYSDSTGLPELKTLLAKKLRDDNGVPAAEKNILVANGAKQALFETLQAVCGPGDEVLIPAPYWVTFPEAAKLAGAKPVFVDATGEHQLDPDKLGRAVTRRTKVIVLNSPNNPTGAVYPAEALREIAALARRKDLIIVSDEAYEHLTYDGRAHVSMASLGADAARRTVTVQTFSKSHSMTGFRVGYLCASEEITRAVSRIHGHVTGNVCTFAQRGAVAALGQSRGAREKRRAVFERRRDLAFAAAAPLFDCVKPQGGFFLFADARRWLGGRFKDSAALAAYLLQTARVAVVPGSACGWEEHLRVSFSTSESNVAEGFRRMRKALCP